MLLPSVMRDEALQHFKKVYGKDPISKNAVLFRLNAEEVSR